MTTDEIKQNLEVLSVEILRHIIDGLKNKTLKLGIDQFNCHLDLDGMKFSLWIANGVESLECYSGEENALDIVMNEARREELWDALKWYIEQQAHQAYFFTPNKTEEN